MQVAAMISTVHAKGMVMHYVNNMWLSGGMSQADCMCTTGSDTGLVYMIAFIYMDAFIYIYIYIYIYIQFYI